MVTQANILRRAADLVEQGWCQGHFSLDAHGNDVRLTSPEAVRFCTTGAIERAQHEMLPDVDCDALETFRSYLSKKAKEKCLRSWGVRIVSGWNDQDVRTQAEVVAALRECAECN